MIPTRALVLLAMVPLSLGVISVAAPAGYAFLQIATADDVDTATMWSEAARRIVEKYDTIGRPPAVIDITAHAHVFGRPYGAIEFRAAIEAVMNVDWVWMTTHQELAAAVHAG